VHVALALVQVFFGANGVYGKVALRSISTTAILGVRVLGATALFMAARAFIARRRGWERLAARDLPLVALSGILGVSLNQLLFYEGLFRSTATNAGVLMATVPVFTTGFLVAFGRERPTLARLFGLAVALVGAIAVVLFGNVHAGPITFELGHGELLIVANCLCYSLYLVVSRPLFQRYRTETAVTWIFIAGALTLGPFCVRPMLTELPHAPAAAIASTLYILLGPTVGAYFLNGYALRRAPTSLVAVYIYAQPVIAAVLASKVLDERLTLATLVGGILIGIGIALTSRPAREATDSVRR
jgi:drug/metabolite transporter (DMT)-like permease